MELELTKAQVDSLSNQKQTIRSDRETVSQCLQLVEQLRKKITAHMESAQSITDQLRRILTPVQVAKFLMWVEKNKRSMDLLNTFQEGGA
jgi:DNA replication protein DnaD